MRDARWKRDLQVVQVLQSMSGLCKILNIPLCFIGFGLLLCTIYYQSTINPQSKVFGLP